MNQIRTNLKISKRWRTSVRPELNQSWELEGNKINHYNWGYGPYAYHIKWHGPSAMSHRLDAESGRTSELSATSGWYKHNQLDKVADIVAEYCNYTEESYEKTKSMVRNNFDSVRTDSPVKFVESEPEVDRDFYWSEYRTEFHPWFRSWLFRTLVYVAQGVESNIDLAQSKMYFRSTQSQFQLTEFKIPGDHLMSTRQFDENQHKYYTDIQAKSEMPPVCLPRPEVDTKFQHKSKLFEHCDGSDLILTDVSPARSHETRPIIMREGGTGTLRYCTWKERERRLQAYYPTKYRSLDIPIYIDPDHPDTDHIMDNFITNFEWKGSMQIMEAAVSYFDLNDERYCRLRKMLNSKLIDHQLYDHFYATRHGGQFLFQILEDGHAKEYIDHLTTARSGPALVQELRTMFVLLELVDLDHSDLLGLTEAEIGATLDRIFVQKYFESKMVDKVVDAGTLLDQYLTYDDRYMLNGYPDYKRYMRMRD